MFTQSASTGVNVYSAHTITILASHGFTPGIPSGMGIKNSIYPAIRPRDVKSPISASRLVLSFLIKYPHILYVQIIIYEFVKYNYIDN